MPTLSPKSQGFSLIEVVLAIGVATVALVSIVGLLSIAVTTNGASANDTMLAAMSAHVLSDLRSAPFDALGEVEPGKASNQSVATLKEPPENSTYFFTVEGVSAAATDESAIYRCVVTKTPDSTTRSPSTGPGAGPCNLVKLQLSFTWPVGATKSEKRTVYASIARY